MKKIKYNVEIENPEKASELLTKMLINLYDKKQFEIKEKEYETNLLEQHFGGLYEMKEVIESEESEDSIK